MENLKLYIPLTLIEIFKQTGNLKVIFNLYNEILQDLLNFDEKYLEIREEDNNKGILVIILIKIIKSFF